MGLLQLDEPGTVGAKALIPNPALRPFQFLIGEWRTTGTHPMVPDKKLRGTTSFSWHEGGAFLIMRQQVDEPSFPDGVAIIGSDDGAGTYSMIYFDERGTSRLMEITSGKGTVTWKHDDPKFAQSLSINAEGPDRLVSKGRMSNKGGPWEDDLSQTFERAAPGN
jgi:hypothetical protein